MGHSTFDAFLLTLWRIACGIAILFAAVLAAPVIGVMVWPVYESAGIGLSVSAFALAVVWLRRRGLA